MATKPDPAEQIKRNNKAVGAAAAAGDSKAIAGMYTRTARLMAPNAPAARGRKAIQGFWQGALDMGVKGIVLRSTEVDVHGATAIEVGAYKLTGAGGAVLDKGKYIVIWQREDGIWKVHRDIFNSDNPAV